MRQIKFREWDETNKVMHNDFQFIKSGDEGNDWIIFISDKRPLTNYETNPFTNPSPYFSQQLKVMQYTGLKDKNGKEIYEGDIIKFSVEYCTADYYNMPRGHHDGYGSESGFDGVVVCNTYKHFVDKVKFTRALEDAEYVVNKIARHDERQLNWFMTIKQLDFNKIANVEVIGNIYENPELLNK